MLTPLQQPTQPTESKPRAKRKSLRALQFNVWLDATKVRDGITQTADIILDSQADIVSLIEVKNFLGEDFVERLKRRIHERSEGRVQYYGSFAGNPMKLSFDADAAIISKHPIVDQTIVFRTRENCIVRSLVQIDDQTTMAVYSVHLEYRYYTCYLPRGYSSNSDLFPGWSKLGTGYFSWIWEHLPSWLCSPTKCLDVVGDAPLLQPVADPKLIHQDNTASQRPAVIQRLIDDAQSLRRESQHNKTKPPIILVMGDFNEPSTLDWTESTKHLTNHSGLVYEWDTTERLRQSGFVDTYREMYPNPATHPGFTWPAAARGSHESKPRPTDWIKQADERDRIDFIFYYDDDENNQRKAHEPPKTRQQPKQLKVQDSWIVGTPVTVVQGQLVDESKLFEDKCRYPAGHLWPSDHRAVMTVFELLS